MSTQLEIATEMRRLSALIDKGVDALRLAARAAAEAEMDYRQAKAVAWTTVREGTVPERQAHVDAAVSDRRFARDLADGQRVAALEALRSRRAQLSAAQTLASAFKSEAEMSRFGAEVGP